MKRPRLKRSRPGKANIDNIDTELRAGFTETGAKLKTAKLPQQILDRHAAFVKRYTDYYTQLKTEIDDIDKAKTKGDLRAKIEKARFTLEKVKLERKHIPLDPNNPATSHNTRERKATRLSPEEFRSVIFLSKSHISKQKIADSRMLPYLMEARQKRKPVVLAFNETAERHSLVHGKTIRSAAVTTSRRYNAITPCTSNVAAARRRSHRDTGRTIHRRHPMKSKSNFGLQSG